MVQFTPGELEVMQVLWDHGEMKPAEIQDAFVREIKNPALRSVLSVLVDKGHVTRRQVGKAFFYKAKTRRQSAFRSMLRDLAQAFGDGSTKSLLFNLVKAEKLTDEDVAALKRLIDGGDSSSNR